MTQPRIFPVILAGGASSRLWPASGRAKPKWDLRLFGQVDSKGQPQSLLEGAWVRGRLVAPAQDCFVIAGGAQADLIRRSLPELPAENLLIEPEPRDTAGAVAYAAGGILRKLQSSSNRDERPVMFVLPGDHVIHQVQKFAETAKAGAHAAVELDSLITFGILPRSPATGYGYIHRGEAAKFVGSIPGTSVYRVSEFREKPDRATAEKYVGSGEYYWNGGIFLWQLSTLMAEFEQQLPGHAAMAKALANSAQNWDAVAREHFPKLKKISIDFGIMEHAKSVATVVGDFDWDDIGSWSAVCAHLPETNGNRVGQQTQVIPVDSQKNLIFAPGKRVALVGVEGLAVVESEGEILICRLDRDQDVKKVSEAAHKKN